MIYTVNRLTILLRERSMTCRSTCTTRAGRKFSGGTQLWSQELGGGLMFFGQFLFSMQSILLMLFAWFWMSYSQSGGVLPSGLAKETAHNWLPKKNWWQMEPVVVLVRMLPLQFVETCDRKKMCPNDQHANLFQERPLNLLPRFEMVVLYDCYWFFCWFYDVYICIFMLTYDIFLLNSSW